MHSASRNTALYIDYSLVLRAHRVACTLAAEESAVVKTFVERFNFPPREQERPSVSTKEFRELLRDYASICNDKLLPIELGLSAELSDFGSLGRAVATSSNWNSWCQALVSSSGLLGLEGGQVSYQENSSGATLTLGTGMTKLGEVEQFACGLVLSLLRRSLSNDNLPCKIRASGALAKKIKTIFDGVMTSNESGIALRFSNTALNTRLFGSNVKINRIFSRDLDISLRSLDDYSFTGKVVRILREQENLVQVTQSWVAEKCAVSERNLCRKLQEEGTTFREIIKNIRNAKALGMLFIDKPISDIAHQLGFSERAAFERAFMKWQGITPVKLQAHYARLSSKERLKKIFDPKTIPMPPALLIRLITLLNQDDGHLDELVELVETDPVLVSKVLSLASSAFYGFGKVDSVKQAILKAFGTEKLHAIALTLLSNRLFDQVSDDFPYEKFWFRALSMAHTVSLLFDRFTIAKKDQFNFYLAALLHNIGHLAIAHCLVSEYKELKAEGFESLRWSEQQSLQNLRLGINSLQVSTILLNVWSFPVSVIQIIANTPTFLNGRRHGECDLMFLASAIVEQIENNKDDLDTKNKIAKLLLKHSGSADKSSVHHTEELVEQIFQTALQLKGQSRGTLAR